MIWLLVYVESVVIATCVNMHSVEELGTNVPAFLAKLWKMVEDTETNDLIFWSPSGTSFSIRDQARFARQLLPLYYKHNNMASFVRQLNMYGFHKVVSIESGGLKVDRDDMEFAHQCFLMGHPYLLEHIKRKIPTNKSDDGRTGTKPELVNKVLSEVKSLRGRQDSVDSQLSTMKRENEVLWREVAILRQKHIKQQQIVNKLIQFLVSMVQTSRGSGIGIKRHYPLMINDITHHSNKSSSKSNSSPTGPVIHELDPELLDDCSQSMDCSTSAPVFDLCVTGKSSGDTATMAPTVTSSASIATIVNGSILDACPSDALVEELPKNDGCLETIGNHRSYMGTGKLNKGKQKSSAFKGSKRHKSKLMPAISKTSGQLVTIKTERTEPEVPVTVNNFLEIMLPSLVRDAQGQQETIEPDPIQDIAFPGLCEQFTETEERTQQNALEAATDAAISAIGSVAAQTTASGSVICTDVATPNFASKKYVVGGKSLPEAADNGKDSASSKDLTLACAGSGEAYTCKEDFDAHLDSMQSELDTLKELLKGEGYNLDANMLLGVCAAGLGIDTNALKLFGEDSLSYGIHILQDENLGKEGKPNCASADPMVSGSELMTYSSNLLDLADMSGLEDWGSPAGSSGFTEDVSDELNTPLVTVNSPGFSGVAGKK